jgi:hypothetical protein
MCLMVNKTGRAVNCPYGDARIRAGDLAATMRQMVCLSRGMPLRYLDVDLLRRGASR